MIVAVADEIVEQSETCERLDSLDGLAEPVTYECGNVARGSAFQFGILRAGQNAEGLREVFLMASEHVGVVGIASGRAVVAFAAHNRTVQVEQSDVRRGNTAAQGGFGAQIFKVKDIAIGRRFKDMRRRGPAKGPIPVCFPAAAERVVIQTDLVLSACK